MTPNQKFLTTSSPNTFQSEVLDSSFLRDTSDIIPLSTSLRANNQTKSVDASTSSTASTLEDKKTKQTHHESTTNFNTTKINNFQKVCLFIISEMNSNETFKNKKRHC